MESMEDRSMHERNGMMERFMDGDEMETDDKTDGTERIRMNDGGTDGWMLWNERNHHNERMQRN